MRIPKKHFFILLSGLMLAITAWGQSKEEKEIRKVYQAYDYAVKAKMAGDALAHVTESTLGYYDFALMKAQNSSREVLSQSGIMEKIEVLKIRQGYTPEQMGTVTGKEIFEQRVREGLSAREHLPFENLGSIKVDGELATAEILDKGKPSGYFLQFQREDGDWKVDLVSLFSVSASMLDMMLSAQSMTHDQYLQRLIPMTTGKQLTEADWQPAGR